MDRKSDNPEFRQNSDRISRQLKAARAELYTAGQQLAHAIENEFPNQYLKEQMVEQAKSLVRSIEQRILDLEETLSLLRPPTKEELEYRKKLLDSFAEIVGQQANRLRGIRFHGADWIHSAAIIRSGEISSSQERGMDRSSFDVGGQISVTDAKSVQLSLRDYTGIQEYLLPMGCLFVLEDTSRDEIGNTYVMESVKMKGKNAVRFKVLASTEMLQPLKKLLSDNGLSPDDAIEYFDYLRAIQK